MSNVLAAPKKEITLKNEAKKEMSFNEKLELHLLTLSLDGLKELRSNIGNLIQSHSDYVKKERPTHLDAKKQDLEKVLNAICGKSAAYKKIVSMHNEGTINLKNWSTKDIQDVQLNFVMKSFKNLFFFTTKEENVLSEATPKIIGEIIIRAAIMKPENFTKAISKK